MASYNGTRTCNSAGSGGHKLGVLQFSHCVATIMDELDLITLAVDNSCPMQLDSFLSEDCVSTDQGETLSTGAIAGGIVGGVCVLLIFTGIIIVAILVRRRKLKIFRYY